MDVNNEIKNNSFIIQLRIYYRKMIIKYNKQTYKLIKIITATLIIIKLINRLKYFFDNIFIEIINKYKYDTHYISIVGFH